MNKYKIIKDLKKQNDSLKLQYEYRNIRCVHLEIENQQLKHNRDKAIEYVEKHTDKLKNIIVPKINFNYKELLNILKGDSDGRIN